MLREKHQLSAQKVDIGPRVCLFRGALGPRVWLFGGPLGPRVCSFGGPVGARVCLGRLGVRGASRRDSSAWSRCICSARSSLRCQGYSVPKGHPSKGWGWGVKFPKVHPRPLFMGELLTVIVAKLHWPNYRHQQFILN